jgi:hypothetical protein
MATSPKEIVNEAIDRACVAMLIPPLKKSGRLSNPFYAFLSSAEGKSADPFLFSGQLLEAILRKRPQAV